LRWSMGLMGTGPAHLVRGAQQRTHVARSVQASREPRSNPFLAPRARALTGVRASGRCLRVLSARVCLPRHWRDGSGQGDRAVW
jgi:hypothetical protein